MISFTDNQTVLANTLSKIGKLESPQVTSYLEPDRHQRQVHFKFRFSEELDQLNGVYLKLIYIVNNFEGNVPWIMNQLKNHKNYLIEPLEFYFIRRKFGESGSSLLKEKMGDNKYEKVNALAIKDLVSLSDMINSSFQ